MANLSSLIEKDSRFSRVIEAAKRLGADTETDVYLVGGYVRDLLLGRELSDIDLMVVGDGIAFARRLANALSVSTIIPFPEFGTAAIPFEAGPIEVATARTESYQASSRKPNIRRASLEEDLSRRDFTINAMALSISQEAFGELADPFGGVHDLMKKLIRTPLDPDTTFSDDPLRILRAARLAAQLEFHFDEVTVHSMKRQGDRIRIVSSERVTAEFYKILSAKRPSIALDWLQTVGVLPAVFPEISAMCGLEQPMEWRHKDIFHHTLEVVDNMAALSEKSDLRFAALVHDIGKPKTRRLDLRRGWTFHGHEMVGADMLERVARRMRLSNKTKRYLQNLTRLHLRPIALAQEGVTDAAVRRLMVDAGDDLDDLLRLCRADITTKNTRLVQKYLKNFEYVERLVAEVREKDDLRAFQSPVRGDVIMRECGLEPGPIVGEIKSRIEAAILDGEIPNEYDSAYAYFQKVKDEFLSQGKLTAPSA